jgi:antitoxin (DNA-binding transcriptional repressor) of toxin-antitoxin stability system
MTKQSTPTPSSEANRTGKTFADVFYSILTDWRKFVSFFGLLFSLSVLSFIVGSLVIQRLKIESVSEVDLSSGKILFKTTFGGKSEYVTIIHPQGWQDTDIQVKKGEHIKITSGGKITVDLAGIVETVQRRKEIEKKYERSKGLQRTSEAPEQIPELYFSDQEKKSLKFNRGWVGPNGYVDLFTKQSFRARAKRKLLPDKNLGMLLGAVNTGNQYPAKGQIFPIGTGLNDFLAPDDGYLWFVVNDDTNDYDPTNPDLFFGDNLGFFWVKVEKTQ